jgi:hypothetical protein
MIIIGRIFSAKMDLDKRAEYGSDLIPTNL